VDTVETSIETKVEQLRDWLSQKSEYPVRGESDFDHRCHRFYFGATDKDWRYILDIYKGDITEQGVAEMIGHLSASNWLQVLETNAGKLVPFFMDKRFANTKFRVWPSKSHIDATPRIRSRMQS
jgi:hypothetical protein